MWDDYNHVTLEVGQNDQYLDTVTVTWDEVRHKAEVVWTDDNGDEQVFDLDTNKMEKLEYLSAVITIRDSEAE